MPRLRPPGFHAADGDNPAERKLFEAQDSDSRWLDSLTCLVSDPEKSPVWPTSPTARGSSCC